MFDVFSTLKGIFKDHPIVIDGRIFKLHYRITTIMLVIFCLMVTARQYFGEPIACMPSVKDEIPKEVIETYCWVHSTYTLPRLHGKEVGKEVAHPGLGKTTPDDDKLYYKYYQWVSFILVFQAVLFYLPHFIWKSMESGTIKKILLELNYPVQDTKKREESRELLTCYLRESMHTHNFYAYKYFFCELLNFVNIVAQIYMVDSFLGNEFLKYGTKVIEFTETDQENRSDPMMYLFPRVTKCVFHKYGPTGDIMTLDALCVLPLNIVNEKIFVIMWFWFVLLAAFTGLHLLLFIPILFWKKLRYYFLRVENRYTNRGDLEEIMRTVGVGDWLMLHFLGKNMDPINFKEVMHQLSDDLPNIKEKSMQPNGSGKMLLRKNESEA